MNKVIYKPQVAYNPGETLQEVLDEIEMTQKDLADRTGLTTKTINEIIKGKNPITPDTAIKLERVLSVSSSFWNNLQTMYEEYIANKKSNHDLNDEIELLKKYTCYAEMAKYGWVEKTRNNIEKIKNLLRFFRVDSLHYVPAIHNVSFRKTSAKNISDEALMVWLRQGEIEARNIKTEPYDEKKLRSLIPYLRSLTKLDASEFSKKIVEECAKCGVAVVFLPALKNTYVNGATRWLGKDKALLQLSLRNKYADIFWFSFFHELGHILLHGKKDQFLDLDNGSNREKEEIEADTFAQESLIPAKDYQNITKDPITTQKINELSDRINVSKGIIAGRLAHDGFLSWSQVSKIRQRLCFKNSTT